MHFTHCSGKYALLPQPLHHPATSLSKSHWHFFPLNSEHHTKYHSRKSCGQKYQGRMWQEQILNARLQIYGCKLITQHFLSSICFQCACNTRAARFQQLSGKKLTRINTKFPPLVAHQLLAPSKETVLQLKGSKVQTVYSNH